VLKDSVFISAVDRLSSLLDKAVGALCGLFFGTMTFIVLLGVFFRYVLNMPLSWVEETSRYLMIWGASSAISLGIKADEHVGLTVLLDSLKSRLLKGVLYTFVMFSALAFFSVLLVYSLRMVKDAQSMQTQALGVSMAIPYLAIPVSMVFAVLQLILSFILRIARDGVPKHELSVIDI